ncbi:MAG: glycyl-radical enzyme activating protein [Chloroflexi bacterium]|nr:glycyl-radical enzyme activating protein [Chloroflexota bacterium]
MRLKCDRCLKCLAACPMGALSLGEDGFPRVDRLKCTACGKCVPACLPEALTVYGRKMTAEEVFDEVRRDKPFYDGSGGGLTVTGGEPLHQASFLRALFQLCRQTGISTCIETSGYAGARAWQQVLPVTDYVILDLKHMDPRMHRELTGRPNRLILAGAGTVASSGVPVLFRLPLVPGLNDDPHNIEETAAFVKSLAGANVQGIEIMPYHRLGSGKYQSLDMPYPMSATEPPAGAAVEAVRQRFEALAVPCRVSD